MEKYGFIYIWYDTKRKMFYVGSHWGHPNDGYVCSSKTMRDNYRNRPETFKKRIISKITSTSRALWIEEQRWLSMIKLEELGTKYYNLTNRNPPTNNGKSHPMYGKKFPQERKDKIAEALTGNKNFEGKIHTNESKQKISQALKGKSNFEGHKHSEETIKKISQTQKGRPLAPEHNIACHAWERTDETKQKMALAKKGKPGNRRKEYIITFPDGHCETIKGLSNFCAQYNLKATGFHRVLNGTTEQNNYKGYKISSL